jgi:TusA-related sulfurtransferase
VKEINSLGKNCPEPILDLAKEMKAAPNEDLFLLLSDDVATLSDLGAWSRMTGHEIEMLGDATFRIRRKS